MGDAESWKESQGSRVVIRGKTRNTKQCRAAKRWRRRDSTSARKKKGDDCTRTKPSANETLAFARRSVHPSAGTTTLFTSSSDTEFFKPQLFCCADLDTCYFASRFVLPHISKLPSSLHSLLFVLDFSMLFPGILAVFGSKNIRV